MHPVPGRPSASSFVCTIYRNPIHPYISSQRRNDDAALNRVVSTVGTKSRKSDRVELTGKSSGASSNNGKRENGRVQYAYFIIYFIRMWSCVRGAHTHIALAWLGSNQPASQPLHSHFGFAVSIVKINLFELIFIHFIGREQKCSLFSSIGIAFSILFQRVAARTACTGHMACNGSDAAQ